jgi:hypothetical protein
MKELTLERNPMNVSSVGKLLLLITFTYMKGFTVERNRTHVINVGKFSFIPVPSEDIIRFIVERNCKYSM